MLLSVLCTCLVLGLSTAKFESCRVPTFCKTGAGEGESVWSDLDGNLIMEPGAQATAAPSTAQPSENELIQSLRRRVASLSSPGWINGPYGYQYKVSTDGVVQLDEARKICSANVGGGAIIYKGMMVPAQRSWIINNVVKTSKYQNGWWIDLRKVDGVWKYRDGTVAQGDNVDWAPNQPDGSGNCAVIAGYMTYQFDDVPCRENSNAAALCEREIAS